MMTGFKLTTLLALSASALALAACSQGETTNEATAAAVDGTLASAIGDAPGLTTVSDSLSEAGLGEVAGKRRAVGSDKAPLGPGGGRRPEGLGH